MTINRVDTVLGFLPILDVLAMTSAMRWADATAAPSERPGASAPRIATSGVPGGSDEPRHEKPKGEAEAADVHAASMNEMTTLDEALTRLVARLSSTPRAAVQEEVQAIVGSAAIHRLAMRTHSADAMTPDLANRISHGGPTMPRPPPSC